MILLNKDFRLAHFSSLMIDNGTFRLNREDGKLIFPNDGKPNEMISLFQEKDLVEGQKLPSIPLNLYYFREAPEIITEGNTQYVHLKFGNPVGGTEADRKVPICKMGLNCTPNSIGKTIKINQFQNLGEAPIAWQEFQLGKTGMFEFQVENTIIPDKELEWVESFIYINVFDILIPINYIENDYISKIDFVINYAYELKDINL